MSQVLDQIYNAQTTAAISPLRAVYDEANLELADAAGQLTSAQLNILSLQGQIDSLNAALAAAVALDATDEQKIADLAKQVQALTSQIANLQSVKIFDALEYGPWGANHEAKVGGSGFGTEHFMPPGVECAEFSILPQAPASFVPPQPTNYFDCYFSRHLGSTFNAYNTFKCELSFMFPTQTDSNASQCLEWEGPRQLVGGKAFIAAMQLQFSGKVIRYWDPVKKWVPTNIPLTRFSPGAWNRYALETHRDDSTLYYDALTINGQRIPLNLAAPFESLPWPDDVKFAIQLDGNGAGIPYRVKVDNVRLTISQ